MNKFFGALLTISIVLSCSGKSKSNDFNAKADFTYTAKTDSQNYVILNALPEGNYDLLEWVFPDKTTSNNKQTTFYFPLKGTYAVTLNLWKDGMVASATKNITIAADDPNYHPNPLIWSDEFDSTALNTKYWSNETNVDVNNEWQKYTDGNNLTFKDGILTITAYKTGPGQHKYDYTSGRINTFGKKEFLYGRFEIRAKLPSGRGTWPATWMLGSSIGTAGWPACGELDIMEHVGYDPYWIQGSIHTPSSYGNTVNNGRKQVSDCESEFHVYGMTWTPDQIEYYVDDPKNPYYIYHPAEKNPSTWPFDKPCFVILNLAIGGNWGGAQGVDDSIFPVEMKIDYVRVYNYK
jgi:Beta-glucanase/Beta-glucan synthetase